MTNVADPDWREVMTPGRPVPAARIDGLFDSRIDVFDLDTRSHLGTTIWDQALVRILKTPRGLAVYRPELTDDLVPKVVVYRLGDG